MVRRFLTSWFIVAASVIIASNSSWPQNSPVSSRPSPLITTPINEQARVVLRGSAVATRGSDIGPVSPTESLPRMVLVLRSHPEQEQALAALIARQQNKQSPDYHRWLTPAEFGEQFGPAPADISTIKNWLQSKGFSVDETAVSKRWIQFSGTTSQVETAFGTRMRRYQAGNIVHMANASDLSLPAALSPVVEGVLSLNDFRKEPMLTNYYKVTRNAEGELMPDFTLSTPSGTVHFLAPGDVSRIYNLDPLYKAGFDGTGQTIAIAARSSIDLVEFRTFRQIFSLPDKDPNLVFTGSSLSGSLDANDLIEASLDAEWAGALAPNATVDLVISPSTATTDGVDISAAYIIDHNLAPVMSVSFALCEAAMGPAENAFYSALWQQAAAEGISVFVSSGDNGAAGCDDPGLNSPAIHGQAVNGLASTPFNTAVGGTQFNENGNDAAFWISSGVSGASTLPGFVSANGYIPEAVWNESCDPSVSTTCPNGAFNLFSGGGGVSTIYPLPDWQKLNIPGLAGSGFLNRVLPDIALTAAGRHDGYLFCSIVDCDLSTNGNVLLSAGVVGGTSASAPSMAAIMTLINQKAGGRQGLANPVLYQFGAAQNWATCNSSNRTDPAVASTCLFNDITQGNNSVPGQQGFNAAIGFDLATGLGSVNASNLATAWATLALRGSATTLGATTTTTVQHGQPITFSIAVSPTDASGGLPTGAIGLVSDQFGPVGSVALTSAAFSGPLSGLPGGQYNLTAHYAGDGTFGPSDSAAVAVNITPENSSVALSGLTNGAPLASGSSIIFGQFLAIHAAVNSASGNGVATGTVTFTDTFNGNTTTLGTVGVDTRGGAEIINFGFFNAPVNFDIGTHVINATYSGDSSLNPSSAAQAYTVAVTPGTAFPSLSAAPDQVNANQQVGLHVFVGGSNANLEPTGNVQFFDNGSPLGTPTPIAPTVPGTTPTASFQATLPVGTHTLLVQYLGDSHYAATSLVADIFNSTTVTVVTGSGASTQCVITASTNSPVAGQTTNYTVTVTSSQTTPPLTGTVELFDEEGILTGSIPLVNGTASIPLILHFSGTHQLEAQYSGDANYALSVSAPLAVNVLRATPTASLSASAPNVNTGTQVTLAAVVSLPAGNFVSPSGTVQFMDSLNGGPAQPIGSPVGVLPINLSAGFADGFKSEGALATTLPAGEHILTANYSGDIAVNTVNTNSVSVSVASRTPSHTALSADALNPVGGQTVHFTVAVAGAPSSPLPTGTVQLVGRNLGTLGTSTLINGSATFAVPWTSAGFQAVSAQYSGDAVYASSQSNLVTVTLPAFELFTSANDLPVVAGAGAAVGLTLDPLAGFNAPVTFSCSGNVPAGANCSFSPGAQITLNGTTQTAFLILSTTGPLQPAAPLRLSNAAPWWALSGLTGLASCFMIALPGRRLKRRFIIGMLVVSVLSFALGCGGSSGNPPSPTPRPTPSPTPSPSPAPSPVSISSSSIKAQSGSSVTFSASAKSATGTAATGTITFFDGAVALGAPVALNAGQAQLQISSLSVGTHAITAHYSGDAANPQATSGTLQQVITGSTEFQLVGTGGGQTTTITMRVLIE